MLLFSKKHKKNKITFECNVSNNYFYTQPCENDCMKVRDFVIFYVVLSP